MRSSAQCEINTPDWYIARCREGHSENNGDCLAMNISDQELRRKVIAKCIALMTGDKLNSCSLDLEDLSAKLRGKCR